MRIPTPADRPIPIPADQRSERLDRALSPRDYLAVLGGVKLRLPPLDAFAFSFSVLDRGVDHLDEHNHPCAPPRTGGAAERRSGSVGMVVESSEWAVASRAKSTKSS